MATIKDIAKIAGVSVTTVSRALNGYSDVNENTRKKIKAVADELKYSPNSLARSLVMKNTKTIGLLVSDLNREGRKDNFTFEVLCGINDCAGDVGYDLVLFSTNPTKQKEKTYTQLCRERRVDGVILQGIKTTDPYLQEVVESDIPCVLVDIPIESETVGYVTTDNFDGAKRAIQHLINCGHRNIAMVNGYSQAFVSQIRLHGYEEAMRNSQIDIHQNWIINGSFQEKIAEKEAMKLLQNYPEITAIFCASDLMALGVLKGAQKLGIKVPEQLSVVGFDDIVLSSYSTPQLTTIAQDKYQLGYEAAFLLIKILEGSAKSRKKLLNTRLVIRESTAKATDE